MTPSWLEHVRQDLRFGARNLAAAPAFTGLAVASLALGIMATTAMYSVIHAVVLDPFPYKDVHELMSVRVADARGPGGRTGHSIDHFLEIAERSTIFEGVIASTISDVVWTSEGEPQRLRGNHVTTNTFDVLGVPPLLGRATGAADGAADAPPVVVLGHRFWQRQLGGDPSVLGRELRLDGVVRTVIGVMPPRFMWRGADVYLPTAFARGRAVEGVRFVHLLGRLKPGVTSVQAEVDLRPILADLQKQDPSLFPEHWRVGLLSFEETFASSLRRTLWILFGAVFLLLLIACVNVSNLLLSRATARQREIAVRAALGAGRGRLVRQLLTESLLLALAGGAAGVALAVGALRALTAIVPPNTIPDEAVIAVNTPVLAFTVTVSVLTAVVFGLSPAWHGSRADLAGALKASGRSGGGGAGQAVMRSGLVVAEVALSVVLLVGATLMVRTVLALQDLDVGVRRDRLLTLRVPLAAQRYPDAARRTAFFRGLLDRVGALPGVRAAALNTGLHPLWNWNVPVDVVGATAADARPIVLHQVSADYTKALGIPLVAGRLFETAEVERRQPLALVNQAFAKRYLGGGEAAGRVVRVPRLRSAPFLVPDPSFEIVGVVGDTLNSGLTDEVEPEMYVPHTLTGLADRLVVLTSVDPVSLAGTVRGEVLALDREQPVTDVQTMEALLDNVAYSGPRFSLALFAVFAVLGLSLAVIGVYGVISHAVSRRTQEIGVRLALGASTHRIAAMVVGTGLKLVGLGVVLGLAASAAAARVLRQIIWGVSPFDPLSFAAVAAVLAIVGIQACLRPALRAARVDPVAALRYQ